MITGYVPPDLILQVHSVVYQLDDFEGSLCLNTMQTKLVWEVSEWGIKGKKGDNDGQHKSKCAAKAALYNPQLSPHLCLEIGIGPFPAETRKTESLCRWKPPQTGYYCVFHQPDPFSTATHVNWRSYGQPVAQWGTGSSSQYNNTATKALYQPTGLSNLLWAQYLLTTLLRARAALLGQQFETRLQWEVEKGAELSFYCVELGARARLHAVRSRRSKEVDRNPAW